MHDLMASFTKKNTHFGYKSFRLGSIALVLATMFLGAACTNNLEARREVGETNVTTREVADNTAQLVGRTVTIRSQPVRKISPTTFTVNDQQEYLP